MASMAALLRILFDLKCLRSSPGSIPSGSLGTCGPGDQPIQDRPETFEIEVLDSVCEYQRAASHIGAFKFTTKAHPEIPFSGVYLTIVPPERLAFDAAGATGRVTLKNVACQTHMTVEIECKSADQLQQYLKMGVDIGTSQTLDNLVAYMRSRSATGAA
jgi:Activator of Hsp90 ATPase homolog 1-like protein